MKRASKSTPRTLSAALVFALVIGSAFVAITQALAQTSTIQFVNPSNYSTKIVSNQPDGVPCPAPPLGPGGTECYHLVAGVSNPSQVQQVEFEYQRAGERSVSIGFASQVADTFHLFWSVKDGAVNLATGNYTLRAILYQNGVEIARDEEAVQINNTSSAGDGTGNPTADAETLEIILPTNADDTTGILGVFTSGGVGRFVMDVRVSSGTQFVQGFYTTTPMGSEPNWVNCGSVLARNQNGTPAAEGKKVSIGCALGAGDTASNLRGVAAVANDSPPPLGFSGSFNDSGDAHRVVPYNQVATTVSVAGDNAQASNSCTDTITANVLDQAARRIVGMNVDVHASGPDDNLAFDTGRNNLGSNDDQGSDQNQPPNSGHGAFELAQICPPAATPTRTGGTQGRHNRINTPDIKHIESVPGTDTDGNFDFRLFSSVGGTTRVLAFADLNDDDLFCSNEPSGLMDVIWSGTGPGTPVDPIAPDQQCPTPQPSTPSPGVKTLTVTKSGVGSGTVTSSPAGINCGNDCSETYNDNTSVTLTAAPDSGSTFAGFTGCDSASGNQCTVSMNANRTVNAAFSGVGRTLTATKSGTGSGQVGSSPAGINCGSDCSEAYANGTTVTLTATPASGSTFGGFTGCDQVSGNECTVTMNADRTVNAAFNSTTSPTATQTTVPPTGTQTQTSPGFFVRSLQVESSHARRSFGGGFTIQATLSPQTVGTPSSCIQGVSVSLQRTVVGETNSTLVGTATTNSSGTATFNLTADRSANYIATVAQSGNCSAATSQSEPVLVRKKVALRLSQQRARPGTTIRIIATVTPCDGHEGDDINLFKIVSGNRLQTGSKASNFNCAATFRKVVRRDTAFQATSPKQDSDHLKGTSPRRGVDVI